MARSITTFLMFEGDAEAAMALYVSLFEGARIVDVQRYGPDGPGPEGSVMLASFALNGQTFKCIDSHVKHAFTFTPAVSLFVECETVEEIERLAAALSEGGSFLMPLGDYGFSQRFCWLNDRFGVSWQLNLA